MFTLTIQTDNAAFNGDEGRSELERIIRNVAAVVANTDETDGSCRDINGNTVGRWHYTSEVSV